MFLLGVTVIVARAPNLLIAPRLWAEEGAVYFRHAFAVGWLQHLPFVYQRAGYLSFFTNLSTALAAHAVPLEYAPFVTTYLALTVQLVPVALVAFGHSTLFPIAAMRCVGVLPLALAPTHVAEVWLTSLHAPVYLAIAAVLLLTEDTRCAPRSRHWWNGLLLLLGSTTGVYVAVLAPVFAWRLLIERTRARLAQLVIVGAALVLQLTFALNARWSGLPNEKRIDLVAARTIASAVRNQIELPLLGQQGCDWIETMFGMPALHVLAGVLLVLPLVMRIIARRGIRPARDDVRVTLAFVFLVLIVVTSLTAFHGTPGARYAVVSGCTLLFLVLAHVARTPRRWERVVGCIVLGLALASGAAAYRSDPMLRCDGASWCQEVALWRATPTHRIPLCPDSFRLRLKRPRAR